MNFISYYHKILILSQKNVQIIKNYFTTAMFCYIIYVFIITLGSRKMKNYSELIKSNRRNNEIRILN